MKKSLFLITLLSPAIILAQAFTTGSMGEKQTAMGGAGTGRVQDAAICAFNPGGLAFLNSDSVRFTANIGMSTSFVNSVFLDATNNSISRTKNPITTPFHAYFGFKLGKPESALNKFNFGMAILTPYGGTTRWENGWTGRYTIVEKKLVSVAFQPTVGYKINEKLGIGGGVSYSIGTLTLDQDLPVHDSSGDPGHVTLALKTHGFAYALGIYYKPSENLSIGLGYQSKAKSSSYKGTATFTVPSALTSQFPSGEVSNISYAPQVIAVGIGYNPIKKLLLVFDVNFMGFSSFKTVEFDLKTNTNSLTDISQLANYKNTVSLRLGGQYKFNDKFIARVGVCYEQTPVPSDYVYADTPDADRVNPSGGLSYFFNKKLSIDFSYRFVCVLKRKSTNLQTNLSGTYKTYAHVPGLSLNYNF